MQISNNTNNFQNMNMYQQPATPPSIQPVPNPAEPKVANADLYEASHGNLINNKDGEVVLTPQGENNVAGANAEKSAQSDAEAQATKDAQREYAAGYVAHKSMQSQVEIYLAVATDNKVELGNDSTATIIESLRDVQKQNNAVQAYATYQENQKGGEAALY